MHSNEEGYPAEHDAENDYCKCIACATIKWYDKQELRLRKQDRRYKKKLKSIKIEEEDGNAAL